MRRPLIVALLVGVPIVAFTWWIASNTYWADTKVPLPPRGEALTNPFYAAQRFTEALGARATRDRTLAIPPPDAVIVLSAWHWNLSGARRQALESWVESGGRLVVDRNLTGGEDLFERWSGIVRERRDPDAAKGVTDLAVLATSAPCEWFRELHDARPGEAEAPGFWMCQVDQDSFLTTRTSPAWALGNQKGVQAVRVPVGRGSVTVVNATPFLHRGLFDGDHGSLFVAAAQLRRGDDLHFLFESDHPSLLALAWQFGRPVVLLLASLVVLGLWRGSVRFGPLEAPPDTGRRSLAEQILGTGRFALRYDSGEPLHAAAVRALDEAARRRIPGYRRLPAKDRASAVARLTGVDRNVLATAVHNPRSRRAQDLGAAVALLETTRRALIERTRSSHARA